MTVNENLIPTGTEPVDGTKYDLRKPTLLTNQPFDDAWTDVEHDADGKTTATFTRPDGLTVTVGGDETITSFQVCTGTGFPAEKHPAAPPWKRDRLRQTPSTPATSSSPSSPARPAPPRSSWERNWPDTPRHAKPCRSERAGRSI